MDEQPLTCAHVRCARGRVRGQAGLAAAGRFCPVDLPCRDEPELLEHCEPVEHQVERGVFAVAEVQYVDVRQADGAPVGGMSPVGLCSGPSWVPLKVPSSTARSSMK